MMPMGAPTGQDTGNNTGDNYGDPLQSAIAKLKEAGQGMPQNQMEAWALSASGNMTPQETDALMKAVSNGGNIQAAWNQGPGNPDMGNPNAVRIPDTGPQTTAGPLGTGYSPGPFSASGDPNEPYLATGGVAGLSANNRAPGAGDPKQNAIQMLMRKLTGGA